MPTKRIQGLLDLRHASDKKVSKPLMEKRRRARINHSLAQLKALVIDPNTTERSRQAKLEKADILELTVQHLHEMQRQQRTALLLEAGNPKKKFVIGYAECAREVELFLTNLIDPHRPELDGELQKRLKDHLFKRLDDFRNIEPFAENLKKESTDEESSKDESVRCSSPSPEDLPLSVETSDADHPEVSPLKKMLHYYSDCRNTNKNETEADFQHMNNFSSKKLKKFKSSNIEEDNGLPSSCQSVTSTTGFRYSDSPLEHMRVEKYPERYEINDNWNTTKESLTSLSEVRDLPNLENVNIQSEAGLINKKLYFPSSSHMSGNDIPDYHKHIVSVKQIGENQTEQPATTRNQGSIQQISLVPRQLVNGDWALVLPASLVPTEKDETLPLSAFKLVLPAQSTFINSDCDRFKQRLHSSSSPLSSTVSDMSTEEYCSRSDSDPGERMEHSSPDSTQIVWRPW